MIDFNGVELPLGIYWSCLQILSYIQSYDYSTTQYFIISELYDDLKKISQMIISS